MSDSIFRNLATTYPEHHSVLERDMNRVLDEARRKENVLKIWQYLKKNVGPAMKKTGSTGTIKLKKTGEARPKKRVQARARRASKIRRTV